MAENKLTDARVRSATKERDGPYLSDGGGLRIRLLDPPKNDPKAKGARLAEYHFKVKADEGAFRHGAIHLGTIGEPFTDANGRQREFTLADARARRNAAREIVAKGADPREAGRLARLEQIEAQRKRLTELETRRTVRDAFSRWRELYLEARDPDGTYRHRKDGGAEVVDLFGRHVLPKLGDRPLEPLRRSDVMELLDGIASTGKRRTANMTLSLLRQFFRWCMVREWMESDPTLLVKREDAGGKETTRERNLSDLEIIELRDRLQAAKLPERIREALWLLLATGVRVGELSAAPIFEFDLAAAEWQISASRTKNGDPHLVHLSAFALARVRRLVELADGSRWLLPARDPEHHISEKLIAKMVNDRQRAVPLKGRSKATATLTLAQGRWTPHDLRRSLASRMGGLGIRPDVIERCLNHRPEGVAAIYQRDPLLAERRLAFNLWGAELVRLLAADISNVTALRAQPARKSAP